MTITSAKQPLVSIVLPTYNRAHVLPHAIKSILSQSYPHLELIVVDDNSKDNTAEVVQSFDDPRIRYYRNDPNLKLPRALNRGFSLANGDYLTWTSDDNTFAPSAIERMVKRLQQGDCHFVYADYYLFADLDANDQPILPRHERLPWPAQLEKSNHIGACFMYSRQAYQEIGEYDPELFLVEDYDYFIRLNNRFGTCHIGEPLYYFRRHDDALFCSRFAEVKACDVLVRYKNGLLSDQQVTDTLVSLLMRDFSALANPWLRLSYPLVRKLSYRLTLALQQWTAEHLRQRLHQDVTAILHSYLAGQRSFAEAKDALLPIMQAQGKIEYIHPKDVRQTDP